MGAGITVYLTAEVMQDLNEAAEKRDLSPNNYAAHLIQNALAEIKKKVPAHTHDFTESKKCSVEGCEVSMI